MIKTKNIEINASCSLGKKPKDINFDEEVIVPRKGDPLPRKSDPTHPPTNDPESQKEEK